MRKSMLGMTLLELLVVMALSAVVIGMVVQFFVLQTRTAERQRAINEVNESARMAIMLLGWDLQVAGSDVLITHARPALHANQPEFKLAVRYHQTDLGRDRQVRYGVGGTPSALRRAEFDDGTTATPLQPAVAGIVAMGIMFETRNAAFVDVAQGAVTTCPAGTQPFPEGATPPLKCEVPWVFKTSPDRFVRQAVVRLVARSETRVPGYQHAVTHYDLGGGTRYRTEPGYMYRYVEQTVAIRNLSW